MIGEYIVFDKEKVYRNWYEKDKGLVIEPYTLLKVEGKEQIDFFDEEMYYFKHNGHRKYFKEEDAIIINVKSVNISD